MTRSPIELLWTAKKKSVLLFLLLHTRVYWHWHEWGYISFVHWSGYQFWFMLNKSYWNWPFTATKYTVFVDLDDGIGTFNHTFSRITHHCTTARAWLANGLIKTKSSDKVSLKRHTANLLTATYLFGLYFARLVFTEKDLFFNRGNFRLIKVDLTER